MPSPPLTGQQAGSQNAPAQGYEMLPHVLVVDDDDRIRDLLTRFLTKNGFVILASSNADHARKTMEMFIFDALIVDIMMPEETGLVFTKTLRESGQNVPVIYLTALGEAQDRIAGFETGADDYLPKPFEPKELLLRLEALLRRTMNVAASQKPQAYMIGGWLYEPEMRALQKNEDTIRLTDVENNLLSALVELAGQTVDRETLAQKCDLDGGERTIVVQVTRLRRKIEADPKNPRVLQTVRGKGYLLRAEAV